MSWTSSSKGAEEWLVTTYKAPKRSSRQLPLSKRFRRDKPVDFRRDIVRARPNRPTCALVSHPSPHGGLCLDTKPASDGRGFARPVFSHRKKTRFTRPPVINWNASRTLIKPKRVFALLERALGAMSTVARLLDV